MTPLAAAPGQNLVIHIPPTISVDPRALLATLPAIQISGEPYLLVCFDSMSNTSTESVIADVSNKRSVDSVNTSETVISGDLSSHLLVSGNTAWVNATLNSDNGIRVISSPQAINGKSVLLRFVAVNKPTNDATICNQGSVVNQRLLTFSPLGLEIDMVAGRIKVKG